ncbi:CCA tRNA nucleotidyltransferase [Neobacillus sp. MM2021_6]|uniref:CCA tRNA nucleotidyltransferase n=1 Tax=Bacillaceae TaxID=186817 RepID=UPI0014081638|nr:MULTISPECIES: CCA tRNA nucleotidyltransferase [Bacillaceae]MBO0958176.1 CCA tRNA nucleotidyltransferase [Neobacillus sp. MM2021_6]NHC18512.1 CCA tRNA nucleotidyltransferase [Bacillus sp. MM2020_4]
MKEPFLSANPVLKRLEEAGYEAYFVGGSVRDYLLNKTINDVDIATSATPEEVKEIFPKTVDIGIEHGTVLVLFNQQSYEITTFRTEGEYQDYRRPKEVSFIRNLQEDLQRRDFTMNAIAMDRYGTLIDPFNGQLAIREKVIRTVGSANNRFQEDALRMMRAIRFVSQLSFTIEEETRQALVNLVPLLTNIAVERKRAEFEKLLVGKNCNNGLRILLETNVFTYLPGLANKKEQIEKLVEFDVDGLSKKEMWSFLLFCLNVEGKSIGPFLRDWRLPLKEIKDIQQILFFVKKRLEQEWSIYDLYSAGSDTITSTERLYNRIKGLTGVESLQYWMAQYHKLPIKQRSEIAVSGVDLMAWFNQQGGPWLKETMLEIEQAVINEIVENDKNTIKEWLLRCQK